MCLREWQKLGLTTNTTLESAKTLLRECCENYIAYPEQTLISSAVKQQDGIMYDLTLRFKKEGT